MTTLAFSDNLRSIAQNGFGTPLLVVALIVMLILPLPPFLLDMFFTFNITLALVVLLAGVYCKRPLDFAVFPTVLLIATLLRLTLNVASTRVVLLNGHTGTDAAGQVVQSFGNVVIGGNYTVGLVVFAILVIINFVVVTKGAGRVSEVSARFTLDAMPGKQMAIDADLNAGLISQDEARTRRSEVGQEADFYGAMDGASKFVRGDAIAGILILVINIVGGLAIGVAQHGMSFGDAMHNYALLTIGDGLVAQVPSLLLSTAAAIVITRVSKEQDMGTEVFSALFSNPKILLIASFILGLLGIIPGMPHVAFLALSGAAGYAAYYIVQRQEQAARLPQIVEEEVEQELEETHKELDWEDVAAVDVIGLEVGYRLIPMVDAEQNGETLKRIKGIRKKLSQELGFLIPSVHIRDNLDLSPNTYRINLSGVPFTEKEIFPDKLLAINPGQVFGEVDGVKTVDPAFGLEAYWIDENQREHAQTLGYTVVDSSTVIATHLSQILQSNASSLLGHEEVQQLCDRLKERSPKLLDELVPDLLSIGQLLKILQNLLDEQIPICDFKTIAETLADAARVDKELDELTAQVRVALRRSIIQKFNGMADQVPVITLQPELEQILLNTLQVSEQEETGFEPGMAEKLQQSLQSLAQKQEAGGAPAILLVQPKIRKMLAQFTKHSIDNMHVLSYQEIPDSKHIQIVGTVG
jgi:flagellar biosynthesis protein FlhA